VRYAISLCALLALAHAPVLADEPPAKPAAGRHQQRSLDDQLLEGLDADLLKDLPGAARPASSGDASQPSPPSAATNPLAIVSERMRDAQRRIASRDTSAQTQSVQRQIEEDLAKLIEQAKQQCAASGKPGSGQGTQAGNTGGNPTAAPPRDSTNRIERGTKESVETADVKDVLRRFWGHLPEKMREELQSSLSEQFLPKYERVIEEYYKRLAEDPRARP
jgi:hypothetical protein